MGNKQGHFLKAANSTEFLDTLDLNKTKFLDWAAVIVFYAALHYVDAYLATKGHVKIDTHGERFNLIKKYLEQVEPEYRQLYQIGHDGRYEVIFQYSPWQIKLFKHVTLLKIKSLILSLLN